MNYAHMNCRSTYTRCVGWEFECLSKLIYSPLNSNASVCVYVNERGHRNVTLEILYLLYVMYNVIFPSGKDSGNETKCFPKASLDYGCKFC